jgi:hypothetical protein
MEAHTFYVPIINLEHNFRKSYDIGHRFTITPFPDRLEKEYRLFGHGYFKRRYGDQIIKEIQKTYVLKYDRPPEHFKSVQDLLYKLEDPIISFLVVLRLLKPTEAVFKTIMFTPPLAGGLPFDFIDYRLSAYHPRIQDEHRRPMKGQEFQKFTEVDLPDIKFYLGRLLDLLKNEFHYRRLFNTLRFFDMGYRSANIDTRLLCFSLAMEVLFKPLKGKLTRGMCERVAQFLGEKRSDREEIYKRFTDIIDFRARIIHGDMTYIDLSRPDKIELVHDLEHFLRLSLQKILIHDDLIETFASLQEREKYLQRLQLDF